MPRSRYSMKLRPPVLYTASSARLTLKRGFASLIADSSSISAIDDLARLDIDHVSPRFHGPHGLEPLLHHVAVELHAVAVGIRKVHAACHVVLDGRLHGDAESPQLAMGGLQLFQAAELPCGMVQAGLALVGRLTRGELEEGEVVVPRAEAEEDGAALDVLAGQLEAERAYVEFLGFFGITYLQHDVAELPGLNHCRAPAPGRLCLIRGTAPSSPESV